MSRQLFGSMEYHLDYVKESDDPTTFAASQSDVDNFSAGKAALWMAIMILGLGCATFVRTMIVRHMRQRIREQQLQVRSALQRRKTSSGMTRKKFVEENLTSYSWEPTDASSELQLEEGATEEDIANQHKKNSECSICLSNFSPGDQVSKSNNKVCSHIFHKECVQEWLILHMECPMCRKEFLIPPIFQCMFDDEKWTETESMRTAAVTNDTEDGQSNSPNESVEDEQNGNTSQTPDP